MADNHPLPVHVVRIKKLKSLLALIENAVKGGDNYLFRNLFAEEDGKEMDILENGGNSCAVFVSWILYLFNSTLEFEKKPRWIQYTHATVFGTVKDLLASGWQEIDKLKPGAVLVWEKREGAMLEDKNIPKDHIGFYVGNDEAISNDSKKTGFPVRHNVTYNGTRKVEKILWHPALEDLK